MGFGMRMGAGWSVTVEYLRLNLNVVGLELVIF